MVGGREGKEARLVLCALFMAASFDKGSECSGLHSRLHCRVTLLKPRLALQLFRLLAIFGFVAGEECGGGVKGSGGQQGKPMKAKPFGLRLAAKFKVQAFGLYSSLFTCCLRL